jgi:hypothetical protein
MRGRIESRRPPVAPERTQVRVPSGVELRPSRLDFRLEGAPWELAWQVRWSAGKVEFQVLPPEADEADEERTIALFQPSQEQWAEFWHTLDDLGVWTWSPEYRSESGGASWRLELARGDRRLSSAGHGAFPGGAAPGPTPEFRLLLEALRGLVDGRRIG